MNETNNNNEKQPNELISISERESLLHAQPGFSELNVNDTAKLVGYMREVHVASGTKIVTEGDLIDSVFIIASGSAEVTHEVKTEEKTGVTLLATLHEGDSIGLKGGQFFSGTGLRTATVTATSSCVLLKLQLEDLQHFLEERPELLTALHSKSTWMLRMQLIKQAAPFAKLNHKQLAGLASNVKELTVAPQQMLFKQDDIADSCYLITSGKIEISVKADDGTEKVLAVLEPYSVVGEAAFLSYAKRNASAKALTETNLLVMDKDILQELATGGEEVPDTLITLIQGHCRPVRHENIIHQQRTTADGQKITTLKDSSTNKYLQLSEEGWFIWSQMNGTLTLAELTKLLHKEYSKANPDEVKRIVQQLVDADFAALDIKDTLPGATSMKEEQKASFIRRILSFRYFFKKADKKFNKLYRIGGFIFYNKLSALVILLLTGAGFYAFYKTIHKVTSHIANIHNLPLWLLVIIAVSMTCQLISPIAKGLAIKHFGREVPQFGIIWVLFGPIGFIDTSDMWLSSSKSQMKVSISGILANLLLATLFSFYAYYTDSTFLMIFSCLCALFIYFQTLRSLNPMVDGDGYEFICFYLDNPDTRDIALKQLVKKNNADKGHKRVRFFWTYSLIYLALLLFVVQVVLSQLLIGQTTLYAYKNMVLIGLGIIFFIEIVLRIQNQQQTQSSHIV